MFHWITRLFPLRTKTLVEFAEAVRERQAGPVQVWWKTDHGVGAETITIGFVGELKHSLVFEAKTPEGRRIFCKEYLFTTVASERGYADSEDRNKAAIKALLLAEKRTKRLRTLLPGVAANLVGPGEKPLDKKTLAFLHRDARKLGVKAYG